jgi:hypothetical protein
MRRRIHLILLLATVATGCATPLGPGFFIHKEELEAQFAAAPSPRLHVSARFELENSGNRPLNGVDVALPAEGLQVQNLRFTVGGRDASPQKSALQGEAVFVPFGAPLACKKKLEFRVSYDLLDGPDERTSGSIRADAFFLPRDLWTPRPLPPEGLFAKGGQRPRQWDVRIRVPVDFKVHAAGKSRGIRRSGDEVEHRFRIGEDEFAPFLIGGRYREHRIFARNVEVIFWDTQTPPTDQLRAAGESLAATLRALEDLLGPRFQKRRPAYVVSGHDSPASGAQPQWRIFPDGVQLQPSLFSANAAPGDLCAVSQWLASLWLEELISPQPEIKYLAQALVFVLTMEQPVCIAAVPEMKDRAAFIASQLEIYDRLPAPSASSSQQAGAGRRKFWTGQFFALAAEDRIGRPKLLAALRRMVQALRGSTWGEVDLRAALENESGQELGEFFRAWLHSVDLPDDFRAKYRKK